MLRVAVLMGGPSSEHDVSLMSGKMVCDALPIDHYEGIPIVIEKNLEWKFPEKTILDLGLALSYLKGTIAPDVVFIALHGAWGEDGMVQALMESLGLPYTGSGVLASALAMDKVRSGLLFDRVGLKTPSTFVIEQSDVCNNYEHMLPCVVKPADGGSSIGVSVVMDASGLYKKIRAAFQYASRVVLQPYITGTEVTCGVVEENGVARALPPTEIVTENFFDYDAKYSAGKAEEITPARLPAATLATIQEYAVRAHHTLGCRGFSRTDMIVSADDIYILETNTIPGLTSNSLLPKAAQAAGIPFPQLLEMMIDSALSDN